MYIQVPIFINTNEQRTVSFVRGSQNNFLLGSINYGIRFSCHNIIQVSVDDPLPRNFTWLETIEFFKNISTSRRLKDWQKNGIGEERLDGSSALLNIHREIDVTAEA